jgi:hypothetical protein
MKNIFIYPIVIILMLISACTTKVKEPEKFLNELETYDKNLDKSWSLTERVFFNREGETTPETFQLMLSRMTDTMHTANKRLRRAWKEEGLDAKKKNHEAWVTKWCEVENKALDIQIGIMDFWLDASNVFYDKTVEDWERLDSAFRADYRVGSKLLRKLMPADEEYKMYQEEELEMAKNRIKKDREVAKAHYDKTVERINERKVELKENPASVVY